MLIDTSPLPYTDSKPVGASDFYLAVNATFRFIHNKLGMVGLQRYWTDLGSRYFAPVSARWKAGGFPAIAAHWQAFFAAEPGSEVDVQQTGESVTVTVRVCPAIKHLREQGREIMPCFCQHCYYINEAMAVTAGYTARVEGGNGSCTQTFHRRDTSAPAQDLSAIKEATC